MLCPCDTARYDLGEEHRRGKERFMAKERDEAVKSARRMRMAEAQVSSDLPSCKCACAATATTTQSPVISTEFTHHLRLKPKSSSR